MSTPIPTQSPRGTFLGLNAHQKRLDLLHPYCRMARYER
jgi:hypothetical protein